MPNPQLLQTTIIPLKSIRLH